MKSDRDKLNEFIFEIVLEGWGDWEPEEYGYEKTAERYVRLIKEYVNENSLGVDIDYAKLEKFFVWFFDVGGVTTVDSLRRVLFSGLPESGAIIFPEEAGVQESRKKIRSSYKRIKSVLYSLAHSFFSLMNTVSDPSMRYMEDHVLDAMKKNGLSELKILFSKRKVFPEGEHVEEIVKSVDYYMKGLPRLAASQGVDSSKIRNVVVLVTRTGDKHRISISAIDDRGVRHMAELNTGG